MADTSKKVVVTGATGLLGRQVIKSFSDADWEVIGTGTIVFCLLLWYFDNITFRQQQAYFSAFETTLLQFMLRSSQKWSEYFYMHHLDLLNTAKNVPNQTGFSRAKPPAIIKVDLMEKGQVIDLLEKHKYVMT